MFLGALESKTNNSGRFFCDLDFCIWNTDQLYIKGVGGYAHLDATGVTIPNLKAIWVINGNNLIIENIEFSGASVPDKMVLELECKEQT